MYVHAVAGIPVTEHLEVNVVPLGISITARFFQTLQDFFFPKSEADPVEGAEQVDHPHSHAFGSSAVQGACTCLNF